MALFSFWQRNPYCLLTYGDAVFYPVRRGEVAAKKGQALIAEGGALVKSNKWFDGARLLRQGLTLYPGDLTGRLTLANYYVLVNQRSTAVAVLVEGLTAEYPGRSYLQSLCDIAEQGEDYDLVVSMANRFMPRLAGDGWRRERRWLATRQFAALLAARKTAEALYFAQAEEAGDLAAEHRVLALLELGRAADAVDFLAEWHGRPGADLSMVRRLQVRAFREAGKLAEMERAGSSARG